MKGSNKIYSVCLCLCIGILSLNTLSSCTKTKQKLNINLKNVICTIKPTRSSSGNLVGNEGSASTNTEPSLSGQSTEPQRLTRPSAINADNKDNLGTSQSPMAPVFFFKEGFFAFDQSLIEDFSPSRSVAICFMLCNQNILLLKRNDRTTAGSTWCIPGGKLEKNETPLQAVVREAKEETGILLVPEEVNLMKTIYVRILTPKQDYLLHLFKAVLPKAQPSDYSVKLNQEHTDYVWIDPEEAKQWNLIPGGKEILELNLLT